MGQASLTDAPATTEAVDLDVLESLLSFYVRCAAIGLSRDLDQRLAGLEVARGSGKVTALLLIDSHPGIRSSVIADATLRDRPAISRIISHLSAAGLIRRRTAAGERRAQELYITERGHALAEKVRKIARDQSEAFFSILSGDDREQLMRILRDLYWKLREGA